MEDARHPSAQDPSAQERRDGDRRKGQRRDPRWRFDPLFAATLVNQIVPAELELGRRYPAPRPPHRAGRLINIRA